MGSASPKRGEVQAGRHVGQPVGRILMDIGALDAQGLADALALSTASGAAVEDAALAAGQITRDARADALARRHAALRVNCETTPPDADLAGLLPLEFCLQHGVLPWAKIGDATLVATAHPAEFDTVRDAMPEAAQPVIMAVAAEEDIQATLAQWHDAELRRRAESLVPDEMSCRALEEASSLRHAPLVGGVLLLAFLFASPPWFFASVAAWAAGSLIVASGLKALAFLAHFRNDPARTLPRFHHNPRVSILVPLFRETEVAMALVKRLEALRYPKALLDVVLVLEEDDAQTRAIYDAATLPTWIRTIVVPTGSIKTKPRALNYALDFCRSDIIGIYDAEDAPDPDQINKIVTRFSYSGEDVACMQGILDFYNPTTNWFSRCFSIEYATWFRVILPGLTRLGFAIPLGGTTIFFRRDALRAVYGWDAHNVTEDADLGIRLARFGYRTELVQTVTREEACNRFWPWVRQRSRWLKGYMVTYMVHMRNPLRLLRELGGWRFFGFQLVFLTTISQFLLAPILWSFWLVFLGVLHPLESWMSPEGAIRLGSIFLLSEALSLLLGAFAIARTEHRRLVPYMPTLMLYFPIGVIAAYKAVFELVAKPFFWDKTTHGVSNGPPQ